MQRFRLQRSRNRLECHGWRSPRPVQGSFLSLLGFAQLALHFWDPPVPQEFRLRHALLGGVQGPGERIVRRVHRGEGLKSHRLIIVWAGGATAVVLAMPGCMALNGTVAPPSRLGNDEQRNREVDDGRC